MKFGVSVEVRKRLLEEVKDCLAKAGFYFAELMESYPFVFDLIARRDDLLLIIKVLFNVDAFKKRNAQDILILANAIEGTPLLIGAVSSTGKLVRGVIYLRFGTPTLTPQSLYDFFIEGIPFQIYAAHGGYYVKVDGPKLQHLRESRRISLGTLAEIAGVSRKALQMYEKSGSARVDILIKLEEFFDLPLAVPLDLFSYSPKAEYTERVPEGYGGGIRADIFQLLEMLGCEVIPTAKCPFDALTKAEDTVLITGVGKGLGGVLQKARTLTKISKITERYSVLYIKSSTSAENIEGTPVIKKAELDKLTEPREILELILERHG